MSAASAKAPDAGRKVLVSTMKNEGPYLLEWLAYHKSIGITDFCIFSNDCTDGTNLILNRLDQMGVVKHFDNPLGPRMDPQRAAYSRANKLDWVKGADWVLIVDADEFLNIHVGDRSVDALIDACGSPDAISINWRLMGSQGQSKMSTAGELVTERYTRGSSFDDPENGLVWGFKTLFRPDKFSFFGVHRPKFDKKVDVKAGMVTWTNAAGKPMGDKYLEKGWRGNAENVSNEFAQVNHYAIKSREDFLLKRLRGTANSKNKDRIDMDYWDKYDINTVEDTTIPLDGVRAQMDEWLKDGDLAALTRACADCSQRVLDYQLTEPDFRTFIDTGHFAKVKEGKKKMIEPAPARFICIGTHHKTGTIWMRKVFRAISEDQGIPFMQCYRAKKLAEAAETGPQIIVNWSSSFPQELMDLPHARFMHIIRDPRDVLLSGMRYHRIAPLGNEKFLRETSDEWGGKSYQDQINALPDDHARLMFEMDNKHDKTVQEMLDWPFDYAGGDPRVADIKYEDLIEDVDCAQFRAMLVAFDIEGLDIDRACQTYWDLSLFGGLAKKDDMTDRVALHVSSGKKAQWVSKLPREIAEPYAERYEDALKMLGYADDSDWVADCSPAKDIAA